jgi:hypothetical protein
MKPFFLNPSLPVVVMTALGMPCAIARVGGGTWDAAATHDSVRRLDTRAVVGERDSIVTTVTLCRAALGAVNRMFIGEAGKRSTTGTGLRDRTTRKAPRTASFTRFPQYPQSLQFHSLAPLS